MENKLGGDFSGVRIHANASAHQSARDLNASAYTIGNRIVFGSGKYAPQSDLGRSLLAHELTHVTQQRGTPPIGTGIVAVDPDDALEHEAVRMSFDKGHEQIHPTRRTDEACIQRQGITEQVTRFLGAGSFSEDELQAYLALLDSTGAIEDSFDSDNKARAVVEKWRRGDSLYLLTTRRKVLLVKEMLSGFTGDDDELAILELLRGSARPEIAIILQGVGRDLLIENIHGAEYDELEALMATQGDEETGPTELDQDTFDDETVLKLQQQFTANANKPETNRLNCILIVRELAPHLFAQDPEAARSVQRHLGRLKGRQLRMTEVGKVLSDLGLAEAAAPIKFDNGNGRDQPSSMESSAWETILSMVGSTHGWHVFGMAVFNGYHSVTVLVDNRPDGPRVYWADQWRFDPGDAYNEFENEAGSASGFRRYEKAGFDGFIEQKTADWWAEVHSSDSDCAKRNRNKWKDVCRYEASLRIWKFRTHAQHPSAEESR